MVHAFVITGFLGVGKTTMLTNTVKTHFKDKKIALIVNEFGEVGIDSQLLSNVHSQVLEISEGCICCKLAEEFEAGVNEIIATYQPDLIFVETSGASEPFPIFLSLQNLGIAVEGVLCLCDVKNFDSYKENSTAKYQVGGSNILILNKTDLVTSEELETVKQEIIRIKEHYNIKNNLTGKPIFKNYLIHHATQGVVNQEVFEGVYRVEEVIEMQHRHHDHTTQDAITQQVIYLKGTIGFEQLDAILQALPSSIYRLKGVVKTNDVPVPLFINYAFGDSSYEELPSYSGESLLILIGESIQKDILELEKKFDFLVIPKFRIKG